MTIRAEVRSECAYSGECRTYRLAVDLVSTAAPNAEHIESIATMLLTTLADQANEDFGDDPSDSEQWKPGDAGAV